MIISFADQGTEDVFNGHNSSAARRSCPRSLLSVASRKLDLLDSAAALNDLSVPPGNRLETLRGHRDGQYSIRINEQYRVCFSWSDSGASDVEITDYHP
ncbi:MAG: type II toxin-antitoxin system RelE/ParE family toxin [Chloroflexi bacterium]|nr:type II toxin-antitoxin system RelE/ParE family toxin [Chloroflexota bacterium]